MQHKKKQFDKSFRIQFFLEKRKYDVFRFSWRWLAIGSLRSSRQGSPAALFALNRTLILKTYFRNIINAMADKEGNSVKRYVTIYFNKNSAQTTWEN
jgi:hypothetical protein